MIINKEKADDLTRLTLQGWPFTRDKKVQLHIQDVSPQHIHKEKG